MEFPSSGVPSPTVQSGVLELFETLDLDFEFSRVWTLEFGTGSQIHGDGPRTKFLD